MSRALIPIATLLILAAAVGAAAQEKGTLIPQPLPPLANAADPKIPAKELFARKPEPAHLAARAIGNYVRGCLAGAVARTAPWPGSWDPPHWRAAAGAAE